jgi:hypothetical protein
MPCKTFDVGFGALIGGAGFVSQDIPSTSTLGVTTGVNKGVREGVPFTKGVCPALEPSKLS